MVQITLHGLSPDILNKTTQVSLHFRYRNVSMGMYHAIMSLFLLFGTIITSIFYIRKLREDPKPGEVQKFIAGGLILLMMYNLPIKLFGHFNTVTALYDSFINSMMFSYVLCLTLILTHGLTASFHLTWKEFYRPKLIMGGLLFISMWAAIFTDQLNMLTFYENQLIFEPQH